MQERLNEEFVWNLQLVMEYVNSKMVQKLEFSVEIVDVGIFFFAMPTVEDVTVLHLEY